MRKPRSNLYTPLLLTVEAMDIASISRTQIAFLPSKQGPLGGAPIPGSQNDTCRPVATTGRKPAMPLEPRSVGFFTGGALHATRKSTCEPSLNQPIGEHQ